MTVDEAKRRLSFHSGKNEDVESPLWQNGFLPLLRNFKTGEPLEKAFHEIMQIIFTLSGSLQENQLDHNVIADLWGIIELGKSWGYSNDKTFSKEDRTKIESYVDHISYTVFCLLDGTDLETAFEFYECDYPNKINL